MLKVVEEKQRKGDMVYLIHCTGKHMADLGGNTAIAQHKEELVARQYIKDHFESRLQALQIEYKVEIKYASWDAEGISTIISKRAEALDASMVIIGKSSKQNIVKKVFVGSVPKMIEKRSKVPLVAISA